MSQKWVGKQRYVPVGTCYFPLNHKLQSFFSDCLLTPQSWKKNNHSKNVCPLKCVSHFWAGGEGAHLHLFNDGNSSSSCSLFCYSFHIACLLLSTLVTAGQRKLGVLLNVSRQCLLLAQTLRTPLKQILTDALPQSGAWTGVVSPLSRAWPTFPTWHMGYGGFEGERFSKWNQAKMARL